MLVALLLAVAWRWRVTTRPQYALDQIVTAIQRGDEAKLAYYADVSAFTDQIIGESIDWIVAQHGADELLAAADLHESGARVAQLRDVKGILSERIGRARSRLQWPIQ